MKDIYCFDESYACLFIKRCIWFDETFVYQWRDKGVIGGVLRSFGKAASAIGSTIRNYFDVPVINRFFGDGTGNLVKATGRNLRPIQTGRIQQYMLVSLIVIIAIAGLLYYLFVRV